MDLAVLEYPRAVHKPTVRDTPWIQKDVANADECARALDEGWSLTPILIDPSTPVVPTPAPVSGKKKGRKHDRPGSGD